MLKSTILIYTFSKPLQPLSYLHLSQLECSIIFGFSFQGFAEIYFDFSKSAWKSVNSLHALPTLYHTGTTRGAIPRFLWIKLLGIFLPPPPSLVGCLSISELPPPLHPRKKIAWVVLLDPESSALIDQVSYRRLHMSGHNWRETVKQKICRHKNNKCNSFNLIFSVVTI